MESILLMKVITFIMIILVPIGLSAGYLRNKRQIRYYEGKEERDAETQRKLKEYSNNIVSLIGANNTFRMCNEKKPWNRQNTIMISVNKRDDKYGDDMPHWKYGLL
jgi:hypothetical protein